MLLWVLFRGYCSNVPNVWSRAARALKLGTTGPGWAERLSAWSTCGLHVRVCVSYSPPHSLARLSSLCFFCLPGVADGGFVGPQYSCPDPCFVSRFAPLFFFLLWPHVDLLFHPLSPSFIHVCFFFEWVSLMPEKVSVLTLSLVFVNALSPASMFQQPHHFGQPPQQQGMMGGPAGQHSQHSQQPSSGSPTSTSSTTGGTSSSSSSRGQQQQQGGGRGGSGNNGGSGGKRGQQGGGQRGASGQNGSSGQVCISSHRISSCCLLRPCSTQCLHDPDGSLMFCLGDTLFPRCDCCC